MLRLSLILFETEEPQWRCAYAIFRLLFDPTRYGRHGLAEYPVQDEVRSAEMLSRCHKMLGWIGISNSLPSLAPSSLAHSMHSLG
jgi:hypothetical protein